MVEKRITKEIEKLEAQKEQGLDIFTTKDNNRYVFMKLIGPKDTPYENGIFYIEFYFPDDYPSCPPEARFLTKIFHPNIDKIGRICLDILKDKWTAAFQLRTIGLSLMVLLSEPNLNDPLDSNVASKFKADKKLAEKTALEWTKQYAVRDQDTGFIIGDKFFTRA
jgi:ubiquitin-conjugating enzyme E2 N